MVDPGKLIAGTIEVYGEEEMRRRYGDILPSCRARRRDAGRRGHCAGRPRLSLPRCRGTPAPAGLQDEATGHVFAGDTFGRPTGELDWDGPAVLLPHHHPVQFDPDELHAHRPHRGALSDAVYATHFGQVRDVGDKAAARTADRRAGAHSPWPTRRGIARHARLTTTSRT